MAVWSDRQRPPDVRGPLVAFGARELRPGGADQLSASPARQDQPTWYFHVQTAELDDAEVQSVRYVDEVLQAQDISLVESVQLGMSTPAFDQGRIVYDSAASGLSEHGVHHFYGLVLDAYRALVGLDQHSTHDQDPVPSVSA